MNKKILPALLLTAALLAGCGAARETYITVGEETYPAGIQQLDLRDKELSVEEIRQLQAALPDCRILWRLPFQGAYLDLDTEELEISSLTAEELENLRYLENLKRINAQNCTDLNVIEALRTAFPECEIHYTVTIGGRKLAKNIAILTVTDGDADELMEKLRYLPKLAQVNLNGTVPENSAMLELKQAYPDIVFHWSFELFDMEVSSDAVELDLSGIPMESVEEVEAALPLFDALEKLILCDTGLPSEELDALWKRHPETRVIWNVKIGYGSVRTDETAFMPFRYGYDGLDSNKEIKDKQLTEMKYLVDMVCMDFGHQGLTNIEFVRYMPNLKYLIIADTPVTDLSPLAELKNLEYLEAFLNGIADISSLAGCTGLRDVNLCYNDITDITPLLELPNLENIWLSSNWGVPEEQRQLLTDTFPEAKIVFMTQSSTGAGWRQLPRYYEQRDLLGMGYMVG